MQARRRHAPVHAGAHAVPIGLQCANRLPGARVVRHKPAHSRVVPLFKPAAVGALLILAGAAIGFQGGAWWSTRNTLPARVEVGITEAGLAFRARLDTGAVVSSINAQDIEVIGGEGKPSRRDAGRMVSFVLVNDAGERRQLTAQIAQVRGIRTADCREVRYHVYLTVRFRDKSYRVLTNLNDRSHADDKLLLGRNWLRYGFAVAAIDDPEL
jgi:hypothetical protein